MANLKSDLLNEIRNQSYYAEIELVRLAQEPNTYYKAKIENMDNQLAIIALANQKIALVEKYFQEPVVAPVPDKPTNVGQQEGVPTVIPQNDSKPLPGQSHGE